MNPRAWIASCTAVPSCKQWKYEQALANDDVADQIRKSLSWLNGCSCLICKLLPLCLDVTGTEVYEACHGPGGFQVQYARGSVADCSASALNVLHRQGKDDIDFQVGQGTGGWVPWL